MSLLSLLSWVDLGSIWGDGKEHEDNKQYVQGGPNGQDWIKS